MSTVNIFHKYENITFTNSQQKRLQDYLTILHVFLALGKGRKRAHQSKSSIDSISPHHASHWDVRPCLVNQQLLVSSHLVILSMTASAKQARCYNHSVWCYN